MAFERKGLCIEGIVVLLCDFFFDAIDVLTIVQIFEYPRNLVVWVDLRFLVEWLGSFHFFKNIRSKLSKDIKQIAATTGKNHTMAFIGCFGDWIYQCNVRQFVIAQEIAQFSFFVLEHLMPSIKVSIKSRRDHLYLYGSENKMLNSIHKFNFFFAFFNLWNLKE